MNNMKLIMENWRGFSRSEESILEDYSYITDTLGIKLQLDESKNPIISESLREQILNEHMLFEGFLSSLWQTAKESAGKVQRLSKTLYRIYKNPKALESFIHLARKGMNKIANKFEQILNGLIEMPQLPNLIKTALTKILNILKTVVKKSNEMFGWKQAMVIVTTLVLLKFAYKKIYKLSQEILNIMAEKGVTDMIEDKAEKLLELLNKIFGTNLASKIESFITDWKSWLGWIGPIVGGIGVVADGLEDVTKKIGGDTVLTGGTFKQ